MKTFILIQISCLFWSAIAAVISYQFVESKNRDPQSSLSLYDKKGIPRIYLGVPEGKSGQPTLQFLDESGKRAMITLSAGDQNAELFINSGDGGNQFYLDCSQEKVSLQARNEELKSGMHLTVDNGIPLVALTNRDENPQLGMCVTSQGGQFVLGDVYGNPGMVLSSKASNCGLSLQNRTTGDKKTIDFDIDTGEVVYRDSQSGLEAPLTLSAVRRFTDILKPSPMNKQTRSKSSKSNLTN